MNMTIYLYMSQNLRHKYLNLLLKIQVVLLKITFSFKHPPCQPQGGVFLWSSQFKFVLYIHKKWSPKNVSRWRQCSKLCHALVLYAYSDPQKTLIGHFFNAKISLKLLQMFSSIWYKLFQTNLILKINGLGMVIFERTPRQRWNIVSPVLRDHSKYE